MIALAMDSSPSAALRNTCAGIIELHIFKLSVRILAMNELGAKASILNWFLEMSTRR